MAGCWNVIDGDHWTQECWMEPRADIMLGASREGRGPRLDSWEQLRVERFPDGKITYYASPEGRDWLPFQARAVTATSVEFINAEHDYPQRIRYELEAGHLLAEISLADGSNAKRWVYQRERR